MITRIKNFVTSSVLSFLDLNIEFDNIARYLNKAKTIAFGPGDAEIYSGYIFAASEAGNQADVTPRYIQTVVDNTAFYYAKVPLGGHIPVGAVITRIDAYGLTVVSGSVQIYVQLFRAAGDSDTYEQMADVSLNSSQTTDFTTSITSGVIAEGYKYIMRISIRSLASGISNVRFYGFKITYKP